LLVSKYTYLLARVGILKKDDHGVRHDKATVLALRGRKKGTTEDWLS